MAAPVSFVGGMNVPAVIGRMNASVPLAELVMDDTTLTLRPRAFARLMMTEFAVPLKAIEAAYRIKSTPVRHGIGVRLRSGIVAFFWTWRQDAVLAALAARGVTIETGTHKARGLYRLRSNPDAEATLPTLPALLLTLTPALVVAGTALMITMAMATKSWAFRSWIVLVWLVSVGYMVTLWRRSRRRLGS